MSLLRCLGRLGVKQGCCVGSYLQCLGRSRGQEGVLLGSYLRCLGCFRGQKGVLLGSYLRCLGRSKVAGVWDGFGRFWAVLGGFPRKCGEIADLWDQSGPTALRACAVRF